MTLKKQIKTNYEAQFTINPILKDNLKKKHEKPFKSTKQTHNLDHETKIILCNAN